MPAETWKTPLFLRRYNPSLEASKAHKLAPTDFRREMASFFDAIFFVDQELAKPEPTTGCAPEKDRELALRG